MNARRPELINFNPGDVLPAFFEDVAMPPLPVSYDVPDAKQMFAEHVAYVRAEGDALEALNPWYRLSTIKYQRLATQGAILGEIGTFQFHPVALAAAGIYGVAAAIGTINKYSAVNTEIDKRIAPEIGDKLGEAYTLHRLFHKATGQPEIVMRWTGSIPDNKEQSDSEAASFEVRPAADSMRAVADLAAEQDISMVLLDPNMLPEVASETIRHHASGEISLKDWLRSSRGLRVSFKQGRHKIELSELAFTPTQLKALANEIDKRPYDSRAIESIIDVLRHHAPGHPLVAKFDSQRNDRDTASQQVTVMARRLLERRLADTTAIKMTKQDSMGQTGNPRFPTKKKIHLDTTIVDMTARWTGTGSRYGEPFAQENLLDALGITEEAAQTVLAHPDKYSRKDIALAAEYAVYLARYRTHPQQTDEEQVILPAPYRPYNVLQKIKRSLVSYSAVPYAPYGKSSLRLDTHVHMGFRVGTKWTATVLAFVAASQLNTTVRHEEQSLRIASEKSYAKQLGIKPDELNAGQKARADKVALQGNPLVEAYAGVHSAVDTSLTAVENKIYGLFSHDSDSNHKASGGDGSSESDNPSLPASGIDNGDAGVGNVLESPGDADVEWRVRSNHGMSADGYWAENTMTVLFGNHWGDMFKYWASRIDPAAFTAVDGPNLEVSRQLAANDYQESIHIFKGRKIRDYYIHLPVRQGTRPAAINLDGQSVKLFQRNDGTYMMESITRKPTEGKLTYWLVPNTEQPVKAIVYTELLDDANSAQRQAARQLWSQRVGSAASVQTAAAAQLEADYLKTHFRYSYAPLRDATAKELSAEHPNYTQFVADELKTRLANCNVAATAIAIANSSVTPAIGYYHSGNTQNGADTLTAGAAHMWLVSSTGDIIDATPPRIAKKPAPASGSHGGVEKDILELGGLALLLGAGAVAWPQMRERRSRRFIDRASAEALHQAKLVADMAAYAPRFDTRLLQTTSDGLTHDAALHKLRHPHMHSEHIRQSLKIALQQTVSRQDRAALRQASRVLRLVRRAGIAHQLLDLDEPSGLLR